MAQRQSITGATNAALDAAYRKTGDPMLAQISALIRNRSSRLQISLKKLDVEAKRLKEEKKKMEPDNAQLKQTLSDYEDALNTTAALIKANDNSIQQAGMLLAAVAVTAKVFRNLSGRIIAAGGNPVSPQAMAFYTKEIAKTAIKWNVLTLDKVTNFVDSPSWIARMEKWGAGYADLTRNTILQAIQDGAGPVATASKMRQLAENIPVSAAENLTRTLQLTSYREASLGMETVNGGFIEYKIRIAELDDVTCMSCIALHGTRLEIGERVDDHFNGRCTEYYVVPGGGLPEFMQTDSTPGNRQFVPFQNGEDWFNSLSDQRQQQQQSFQASPAKWEAYNSGAITLPDFVGEHQDDTFGRQVVENSLLNILGADAEKYYTGNR